MRIKSYFAPSVQQAISLARKEFGEGVTLVTSHVAAAESREFGEYEVVFAIDEPSDNAAAEPQSPDNAAAEPHSPIPETAQNRFQEVLEEAIAAPAAPQLNLPEKLDRLRSLFVEIGIEPSMVRALMTMVERCIPVSQPVSTETVGAESTCTESTGAKKDEPQPDVKVAGEAATPAVILPAPPEPATSKEETPPAPGKPKYSAAELAFLSSVSDSHQSAPAPPPDWKFGL
jgi:hypothetical protein